jgi:hypothetical protein
VLILEAISWCLKMQRYRQKTIYQGACLLGSKCGKTHLRASVKSKNFPGANPRPPKSAGKGGEGKEGQGRGREVEGRGRMGWGRKGREREGKGGEGEEGRGGEEEGREGREMEGTGIGGKYASWSLGGWTPLSSIYWFLTDIHKSNRRSEQHT